MMMIVILRPEHITDHLPHWLDLYVHWLRSTNTYTLQVMCIAALAHVAICPRSHLRLVEEALDEEKDLQKNAALAKVVRLANIVQHSVPIVMFVWSVRQVNI